MAIAFPVTSETRDKTGIDLAVFLPSHIAPIVMRRTFDKPAEGGIPAGSGEITVKLYMTRWS